MVQGAGSERAGLQGRGRNLYEFCFFFALAGIAVLDLPTVSYDSPQYIAMAEGRIDDVVAPFSGRVLAPYLSASIYSMFGLSLAAAFSAVALLGAALFVLGIHFLYRRYRLEPYALFPAVLAVPWVIGAIRDAYLPDILVMGLVSLFLLSLRQENWILAGIVAVLSILARETGLILMAFAIGFAVRQKRWSFAAALAVSSGVAMLAVRYIEPSVPNVHAMNGLLYMALKIPVNFLRNLVGIQFWSNDMNWCDHPLLIVPFGRAVAAYFGNMKAVGICAPNFMAPVANAALFLSIFGVLPGLTLGLLAYSRRELVKDPWLFFVALYGGVMLLLGTCTGASVYRLLTYGWPLFILATPILWKARFEDEPFSRVTLIAVQLGLSWLGPMLGAAVGAVQWWQDDGVACAMAVIGLLLNAWAYFRVHVKRQAMAARKAQFRSDESAAPRGAA